MKQTFYFNTGVKRWINDYTAEGDIWVNNERHIAFQCEDVPAGATFHSACDNPNLEYHDHLLVFPIVSGNLLSKYAYFNPPPKTKIKFTHGNQWFSLLWNGKRVYFETSVNSAGSYNKSNNTILGSLYDYLGQKLEVTRVNWSDLQPMDINDIKRVFDLI
jgi:hypothetical protein